MGITRFVLLVSVCGVMAPAQTALSSAPAALVVSGDISSPLTLTGADLAKMPRQRIMLQEPDGSKIEYEGVPLLEILKKAGAPVGKELRGKALASYVLATGHDGYQVLFALAEFDPEFADERVIVADQRDGKPLFQYQGPLRIVSGTDKRPARSVRMLEKLEVVRLQK